MIESTRIVAYIYTTLANDATLTGDGLTGVFEGIADPGTATPYVVFFQQSSLDETSQPGYRLLTNELWMIEVIGPADSFTTLETIADRMDTLLGRVMSAAGDDDTSLSLVRVRPSSRVEVNGGKKYLRLGGQYRVYIH